MADIVPPRPPGLHLLVECDRHSAEVSRCSPSSSPPSAGSLPKPVLRPAGARPRAKGGPDYPVGVYELVAWFVGEAGEVRATYGWPGPPYVFFDRVVRPAGGSEGELRGAHTPMRPDVRLLHLPVPADATFLLFTRSEVRPASSRKGRPVSRPDVTQRPLAIYVVDAPSGEPRPAVPNLPVPGELPHGDWPKVLPNGSRQTMATLAPGYGHIHSKETIVTSPDPVNHIDIVILGDGFQENELKLFDYRARAIAYGLVATPPFDAVKEWTRVHVVRAVSEDSGITHCPDGTGEKRTYFGVEGRWNGMDYAGYLGMREPQRAYDAAALVAPIDKVKLIIMLGNCTGSGGSGFAGLQMAFLTEDRQEIDLALHESAHAFTNLADEYITGCPPNPTCQYENQVTEGHKIMGQVWWKLIAQPGELVNKQFRAIDTIGHQVPMQYRHMLGLFWGCMNIDLPFGAPCDQDADPYKDTRGWRFYRSMWQCKMRVLGQKFCRACAAVLAREVKARAELSRAAARRTPPSRIPRTAHLASRRGLPPRAPL